MIRAPGPGAPPPEEAMVIVLPAGTAPPESGAAALIDALCASGRRLSVVLVTPHPGTAAALAGRFPTAFVHVADRGLSLARLRTRAILRIEPEAVQPPRLRRFVARAIRRGIPVFGLAAPQARALLDGAAHRPLLALSPTATDRLPEHADIAAAVDHLIAAMGFERGDGPIQGAMARWAQRRLRGPVRIVLAPLARRIADRGALRAALGRPQTIMCLGNGPTSADPRLAGMAHDALFRVNHQWMDDGYLTRADVIFAGVKKSMRAAGRTLIAVASLRKEEALLGARLLTPWRGPFRYVVVEEIAELDHDALHGNPRPTTGAVMLAAAIALSPQRLIVAGMDLFADEAGAYPGRHTAVNAYTAAHDRETDAAFIRTHLAHYEGEIVTLSAAFAELAQSVADRRFRLVKPARS